MPNSLANELTPIAQKQLLLSWQHKLPRVQRISTYRSAYNGDILPLLRIKYNVPIPIFSGMVDTLQADLEDDVIIDFEETDPADARVVEKVNAAIDQVSSSSRPGAKWNKKLRQAREELIMAGRGNIWFTAGEEDGEYFSNLESVPFEDIFFEPNGGGDLDNHLFYGRQNIWKTKHELKEGAGSIYDKKQVEKLIELGGKDWKASPTWDSNFDIANRFEPLGLSPEANSWVGEEVFHFVEWIMTHKGKKWYVMFEGSSGTWIRFEKIEDIFSSGYGPCVSFASHEDPKNFASKSFADDLYPVADSIRVLFNQDLNMRDKRLRNARAYDKDIFKDVEKLQEAQYGQDVLVPADTKGGTRRIQEGIYEFNVPEIGGTINLIDWLERETGKHVGVTETQQGAPQAASKKVGVTFAELAQVSKRVSFKSKPITEAMNELGLRFFNSLQDYMKKPMAIRLVGEHGQEWDILKRVELNIKKDFEIKVESQQHRDRLNQIAKDNKIKALEMVGESIKDPTMRVRNEIILREVGDFSEQIINLLLDPETQTSKRNMGEVSAYIQEVVLRSKKPEPYEGADMFFVKRLDEFRRKNAKGLSDKQKEIFQDAIDEHLDIVERNIDFLAKEEADRVKGAEIGEFKETPLEPGQAPVPQGGGQIPLDTKSAGEVAGLKR